MAFVICASELRHWQDMNPQNGEQTSCCINVAWWGTITSCSAPSPALRCYFVARSITCLHGVILSTYHTFAFDAAKKEMDDTSSNKADGHTPGFDRIPGTAFSAWISFFPSILVACVGLTKLLWAVDCGKLSDWGQSAAVVTAFAGGMHWLYAFLCDIIHTSQRSNGSLVRHLPVAVYDMSEEVKNQYLDYGRLNGRSFPHALDAKGVVELQQELFISIRIGDRAGFEEALNAFVRRQKHGEHISLDFIDDKNQTPLSLAIARGLTLYAEELIANGARIEVPNTKPAVVVAAEAGDTTMLQRILDFSTCDVGSVVKALGSFDKHSTDIDAATFTDMTRYMIQYVENKSTPSNEGVLSKLVELALHCKDRYLCELVLTSRLLDRSMRGDGERVTLLQAASAYDHYWKLAELNVGSLPSAERLSALLVALRHGSLGAAKLILNHYGERPLRESTNRLAFDHPLDLVTYALSNDLAQIVEQVLDLGTTEFVASATSCYNDEKMNQKVSPAVKHDSMVKLFDAPVNTTPVSRVLLGLISTTAKLEGHCESANGLSSSGFDPSEEQFQAFVVARNKWIWYRWSSILKDLGIEINDHWAASICSPATKTNELLDVRQLVNYLTDHFDVKVEDGLRVAIEQGKAFRLYKRDKVDTPN
jgi:hypothetical protein